MKKAAIIQARENSTRLPSKVLLPILKKPILELMMERVSRVTLIDDIIIATTLSSPNIIKLCKEKNWKYFVGSEEDVLERVCCCIEHFKIDLVVDLTSDCPFADYRHIDYLINLENDISIYGEGNYYFSNIGTNDRTWPDGFDIQVYSSNLLLRLNKGLKDKNFRQHTGWNISKKFNYYSNLKAQGIYNWPGLRLTLDYEEDYQSIKNIIEAIGENEFGPKFLNYSAEQIIDFVLDNPRLLINRHLESKQPGE